MFIATVALSAILAFVFGAGAVGKLTRMRSQVETAAKLGIRWSRIEGARPRWAGRGRS